jgi:hypothetical protein
MGERTVRLLLVMLFIIFLTGCSRMTLQKINEHLNAGGIEFGMSENEVVQRWGEGEYGPGFGGHFRIYEDQGIELGFAGDSDNDLYGKVSYLEMSNPDYSVYSIRPGGSKAEGIEILVQNGFQIAEYSEDTLVSGEYAIALRGGERIDFIQIFFNDKDLKDRNY